MDPRDRASLQLALQALKRAHTHLVAAGVAPQFDLSLIIVINEVERIIDGKETVDATK